MVSEACKKVLRIKGIICNTDTYDTTEQEYKEIIQTIQNIINNKEN